MRNRPYGREQAPPPSFEEATNKRQKARAAGLDPNHWYVVARVSDLQPGDKREVVFWKRSVVLFRTEQGAFHALENRCAHRQIKLSKGEVEGCKLVCQYHGWKYDGTGRVVELSHDTFGHDIVNLRIPSYAVRLRYGFVWVFFGDQSRAASTPIPEIPELEVGSGWTSITCEFRWQAHHSMVLENVSDYTHEYLHRKTEPFRDARLKECSGEGDLIDVTYEAKIGASKLMNLFVDRQKAASGEMRLQYDYPYNRSNTDNYIKHFLSMLPVDERNTHFFFTFLFKPFRVPFTKQSMPGPLMKLMTQLSKPLAIDRIMAEDQAAVEWEQAGYDTHWDAPMAELNPQVKAFQDLTIRKWQAYLDSVAPLHVLRKGRAQA